VNLDEASIARAEALGFSHTPASASGEAGPKITRLFAPPSLDAIRARELLSQELPGHRFELNKIYRLYRAAMIDAGEAAKPGDTAPAARSCPAERCFSRDLIQWQDGLSACAKGLRIGVIDTEIDLSHPAFKGRRIHRERFGPDTRPPAPDWHGTGVLSVLAGNPAGGTPGLIPDAEFFAASIFYTEAGGAMATDTISLLRALTWLEAQGVKLINMSFAGPQDELVKDQIAEISAKGIVLVAAAGNEGPVAAPAFPAAYPQVIAVTAVTKELRNYRYANRGEHIDVAAPGAGIWAAVPGGREGSHSGTSFAAPHVTGIIAVMPRESLTGNKNELLDSMPVIDLGTQGRDPVYGRGMLVAPSYCTPPSDALASAEPSLAR
jgi:subtilisin family serine protease